MAKSVARRWDPDYCDEGLDFVYNYEALRDKLLDNMQSLSKELELTDTFWDLLLQREVVNEKIQNQIQAKWTKRMQAMTLVHHVMEVKVYKFHGFIWALVNSNQSHLAEQLGFDSCDYLDMEVFMKSSSFRCPACHEFYTKAFILTACGHYVCGPCVKGAQFFQKDDKKEDIMCPVPECNKLSEASPSEGNIGLNEDEAFKDLGEAVMKEMTEREEPEVQTVDDKKRSKRQLKTFEDRSGQLKKTVSSLQKYRDVLGRNKAGVQNYIQEEVRKVQQSADEWARGNLGQYQNMCQQVENHLQKYRQWQKAAAEVSVLSRARPGWLEECLKDKFNLPQETLMDAAEKLVTKLDAGMALPLLYTPCGTSVPPAQAKFFTHWALPEDELCHGLAWVSDDLLILTCEDLWRMELNAATSECESTLIQEVQGGFDMSVAADGTYILCRTTDGIIEIHTPGLEEVKQWRPEGEQQPWRVSMNNNNIFIGNDHSGIIRCYSRELMYIDQYDIGSDDDLYHIHATERGTLMKSALVDNRVYTVDLETKEASSFGNEGEGGEKLSCPQGISTVNDGDYILVCKSGDNPVSVYTHDGQFIHHLDVEGDINYPGNMAILDQKGKPSLMALYGDIGGEQCLCVYTLE